MSVPQVDETKFDEDYFHVRSWDTNDFASNHKIIEHLLDKISEDKIFGTSSRFRQYCPPTINPIMYHFLRYHP